MKFHNINRGVHVKNCFEETFLISLIDFYESDDKLKNITFNKERIERAYKYSNPIY